MADTKISGLPAATTPLAGTEQIPVVQGGETRRVSASAIGGGAQLHPGYATSRIYSAFDATPSYGGTNISGGYVTFHPFILRAAATVSILHINIAQAASAGSTMLIGLYSNVSGRPASRLVTSPAISTASAGAKSYTISGGLPLAAGCYWAAALASASSGMIASYSPTSQPAYLLQTVGTNGTFGNPPAFDSSVYNVRPGFQYFQSYASGLPASISSTDNGLTLELTTGITAIYFSVSA